MALRGDDLSTGHWKKQRLRVLSRDAYTCAYCGEVATEVDHVIPRKAGGGHEMDNLVASCRACNIRKGARSESLFLLKSSTPPVFPERPSPTRSKPLRTSPFQSENKPE